jgi:predicted dinucleotide-utilizing enzyme
MKKLLTIGIVGMGTIGQSVILSKHLSSNIKINSVYNRTKSKGELFLRNNNINNNIPIVNTIDEVIDNSDLVVECSNGIVLQELAKKTFNKKKDLMCISIGGLLENNKEILKLAEFHNCNLYIPSG